MCVWCVCSVCVRCVCSVSVCVCLCGVREYFICV